MSSTEEGETAVRRTIDEFDVAPTADEEVDRGDNSTAGGQEEKVEAVGAARRKDRGDDGRDAEGERNGGGSDTANADEDAAAGRDGGRARDERDSEKGEKAGDSDAPITRVVASPSEKEGEESGGEDEPKERVGGPAAQGGAVVPSSAPAAVASAESTSQVDDPSPDTPSSQQEQGCWSRRNLIIYAAVVTVLLIAVLSGLAGYAVGFNRGSSLASTSGSSAAPSGEENIGDNVAPTPVPVPAPTFANPSSTASPVPTNPSSWSVPTSPYRSVLVRYGAQLVIQLGPAAADRRQLWGLLRRDPPDLRSRRHLQTDEEAIKLRQDEVVDDRFPYFDSYCQVLGVADVLEACLASAALGTDAVAAVDRFPEGFRAAATVTALNGPPLIREEGYECSDMVRGRRRARLGPSAEMGDGQYDGGRRDSVPSFPKGGLPGRKLQLPPWEESNNGGEGDSGGTGDPNGGEESDVHADHSGNEGGNSAGDANGGGLDQNGDEAGGEGGHSPQMFAWFELEIAVPCPAESGRNSPNLQDQYRIAAELCELTPNLNANWVPDAAVEVQWAANGNIVSAILSGSLRQCIEEKALRRMETPEGDLDLMVLLEIEMMPEWFRPNDQNDASVYYVGA